MRSCPLVPKSSFQGTIRVRCLSKWAGGSCAAPRDAVLHLRHPPAPFPSSLRPAQPPSPLSSPRNYQKGPGRPRKKAPRRPIEGPKTAHDGLQKVQGGSRTAPHGFAWPKIAPRLLPKGPARPHSTRSGRAPRETRGICAWNRGGQRQLGFRQLLSAASGAERGLTFCSLCVQGCMQI